MNRKLGKLSLKIREIWPNIKNTNFMNLDFSENKVKPHNHFMNHLFMNSSIICRYKSS